MTDTRQDRVIEILLVEDNPGDVRLVTETFRAGRINSRLSVVEDGVAALAFLRRQENYADAPRPDLILLDLSLPRKNGKEVLVEIKQDPNLRRIPICIVTSSTAHTDVTAAYDNYVNCYLAKPVDLNQFMRVLRAVEDFWLATAELPR